MKTTFFLLMGALTGLYGIANAQNNHITIAPRADWFAVEDQVFYQVSNCTPGSSVAFYSRTGGGKMLKSMTANEQGCLKLTAGKKFSPAFVLNTQDITNTGATGTGMVTFMPEKEFSLTHMQISKTSSAAMATITWQALTRRDAPIAYKLLRSTDGINYIPVATFNPSGTGADESFTFSEWIIKDAPHYKIRVKNTLEGDRYISPVLAFGNDVKVYPTVVGHELYMAAYSMNNESAAYRIVNSAGQEVAAGNLEHGKTTVGMSHLAPGNYLVIVRNGANTATTKIVKQ